MKLFYSPGACSLAAHMVAYEAGLALDLVKVDLSSHKTETGEDFFAINSKGYVPALRLADGAVLTENQAVLPYLADQAPQSGLMPAAGGLERYRVQEWLGFIGTELHKNFGPLWNPAAAEAAKDAARAMLAKRFAWLDAQLADRAYLMGETFTVADCYAFVVLAWTGYHKLDMTPYPNLRAYQARIGARPAVQRALADEGLV
ncbi:MAG: glutathione transferase GstA [Bacteroidota bacterium]